MIKKSRKLNILHITYSFTPYGGVQRYIYTLCKYLDKSLFNIFVCGIEGIETELSRNIKKTGAKIIFLRRKKNYDFRLLFDIIFLVKRYKIHIVHTHLARANIYGRLAAFLCGVPAIVSEHGARRNNRIVVRLLDSVLAIFTSKIICNSKATLKAVKRDHLFDTKNTCVVYIGVEDDQNNVVRTKDIRTSTRKFFNIPADSFVIGNIGGLNDLRDHETLIRAFSIIQKKYKNTKLLLIGSPYPLYNKVLKLIKELMVMDDVILLGIRRDARNILLAMDLYVNTALEEGFGIATVEAMLASRPIVVVDAGSLPELIDHKITGIIVPPQEPNALAKAVEELMFDKNLRNSLGKAARLKALQDFSPQKFIKRISEIYNEI